MLKTSIFALPIVLAGLVAMPALSQPAASPEGAALAAAASPPGVRQLAPGDYLVSGPISNAGFIIGDDGVIAIDAQIFVPAAKAELAEIAKLTTKPVNVMILTHSDPDHINGLPAFPRGMAIYAQDNAKAEIEGVIADPNSNGLPPPPEIRNYVPTHTVQHREDLVIDGVRLVLIHTAPAHTDGDLIVYLPASRLVYAGDLLTPAIGPYPGIHLNKHGSSLGWIASVKAMLSLDADLFVSGHGAPLTRDEVKARLATAIQRRAEIKAMVEQGKSLAEIKLALHDAPLPGVAARFPTFIETTYQELAPRPGH